MGLIQPLAPLVVNQIAAGEVIERPASVVRELVDNAIDAGAGRILVRIEAGGRERIDVVDDGCGIGPEDLPLALAPHATSKIVDARDLDSIATLGFRGEALASILAVSRLTLTSRTPDAEAALTISGEGDSVGPVTPAGAPPGTTVSIRNLFFNTPARRKFMRGETTESTHISDQVQRSALAHPRIGFRLEKDGKEVIDVPPDQSPRDRVLAILGRELEGELLEVDADRHGGDQTMTLWGLIGKPALARATNRYHYCFLNGRFIRDKTIMHAVKEAYRGLIEPTRWPMVVLYLEIDPRQVDVNVHPAKAEVRFRDSQSVHGLVHGVVRDRLLAADITPEATVRGRASSPGDSRWQLRRDEAQSTIDWDRGHAGDGASDDMHPASPELEREHLIDYLRHRGRALAAQRGFSFRDARESISTDGTGVNEDGEADPASEHSVEPDPSASSAHDSAMRPRVLQVHDSYVVIEEAGGIAIIDQHALHERVMFEALKERILDGPLESQRLMTPAVVDLSPSQIEGRARLESLFSRLGIEVEPIGPRALAVHAFPTLLFERKVDPVEFMASIFDRLDRDDFPPDEEAALHEVLDMMACKAAVKAGDRMNEDEVLGLLQLGELIERAGRCPHGRPTTIRLSLRELERQFGRR